MILFVDITCFWKQSSGLISLPAVKFKPICGGKKKNKYFPKNIHVFKEGLWLFHRMRTISPGAEF